VWALVYDIIIFAMHAFLIVGTNNEELKTKSLKLAEKLKAKIMEFPMAKIADTRELRNITKLTFNSPTAILINSIDTITEEAGNAFLKNLEEPQENIYYILTASSLKSILPTIISRCEVIKLTDKLKFVTNNKNLKPTLAIIDKIKDRGEAKEFVQNLIEVAHFNLLNSENNKLKEALDLEILIKTMNNLKLNGNVQLQLTNMIISQ